MCATHWDQIPYLCSSKLLLDQDGGALLFQHCGARSIGSRDHVLHGETPSCLKACLSPIIKSKNKERGRKKRRRAEGCLYDILIDQFCW